MKPKFIIRMDDASPFMDIDKWQQMEDILDKYNIKPIVAIIPDNRDYVVKQSKYREDFWGKAVRWQEKGWGIALHGFDHVFLTDKSGLVPRNNYSEFAGVPYDKQVDKIKKGYSLLKDKGILPTIWIAPAHSFDKNTLKAIRNYTDIKIVSDGLALNAFRKFGLNWIPQQVCHIPRRKFGLWTICLHPNNMKEKDFIEFEKDISQKINFFTDHSSIKYRRLRSILDFLYLYFYIFRRIKKKIMTFCIKNKHK